MMLVASSGAMTVVWWVTVDFSKNLQSWQYPVHVTLFWFVSSIYVFCCIDFIM